ncbi:Zinc finger BED domain-containing protein RICESLEEPER 3 [Bienertia sinuspersici]
MNEKPPLPPKVSAPRQRQKKSIYWNHYYVDEDTPNVAKCKYCGAVIGCESKKGTSPLKNHIERCKKYQPNLDKKQKLIEFEPKIIKKEDGTTECVNVPMCWEFDQELARRALAKMVIVDDLPFMFVEREGFRSFCKSLNQRFVVPSRTTITRDCYNLFIEERKKLKNYFKQLSSRVCLTTDTWTSGQNLSYMCLTAHFIDDDWKLHKK